MAHIGNPYIYITSLRCGQSVRALRLPRKLTVFVVKHFFSLFKYRVGAAGIWIIVDRKYSESSQEHGLGEGEVSLVPKPTTWHIWYQRHVQNITHYFFLFAGLAAPLDISAPLPRDFQEQFLFFFETEHTMLTQSIAAPCGGSKHTMVTKSVLAK